MRLAQLHPGVQLNHYSEIEIQLKQHFRFSFCGVKNNYYKIAFDS